MRVLCIGTIKRGVRTTLEVRQGQNDQAPRLALHVDEPSPRAIPQRKAEGYCVWRAGR